MTESSRRPWINGPRLGVAARDKAMTMAKEDYLGARVPRWLKDEVIRRAKVVGVPVSILIRNVLEEAFREGRTWSVTQASVSVDSEVDAARSANHFPTVIGWEKIELNRPVTCKGCGERLDSGAYVTLGIADPGEEHVILCGLCKGSL